MDKENQLIEVCDACLQASCWYGEFMCDKAKHAGIVLKTRAELRELDRENPSYWSDSTLERIYGCIPHKLKKPAGWIDEKGESWGDGEEAEKAFVAAYTRCPICSERVANLSPAFCPKCKAREAEQTAKERHFGMPAKEWDGRTPLYSYEASQYFMCLEDLEDYLEMYDRSEPLRLVICEPVYLQMLGNHYWEDDLPTEGNRELPAEVAKAVEALNKIIGEQGPVSWGPGKYRVEGEILPKEKP